MESTISGDDFASLDPRYCRTELGLPQDAMLIGIAGALDESCGITGLFLAFDILTRQHERLHLVLAGTRGRRVPLPAGVKVHYLGQLPHARVRQRYSALDVSVIRLRDSAFGRFKRRTRWLPCTFRWWSQPFGAMRDLFGPYPHCLYRPGAPNELAQTLERQLTAPVVPVVPIPTWPEQAARLEKLLCASVLHNRDRRDVRDSTAPRMSKPSGK